jgi:hypothetical protein
MSNKVPFYPEAATPLLAGVDPTAVANNQADTPLAYLAGEGMDGLRWISPIYGQRAVQVQPASVGKK